MPQILSITQVNEYIQGKMNADPLLAQVAVRGEISNYKCYPSGHHYFTLKDEASALKCVMFKGNAMRLRFRLDNGMKVIAMGKVTVYPRDGAYQLYCAAMAMDGVGDLYAAFEQLKKKLAAQGLFDPAHKKPLPKCPGTIGVVTSSAGAAVHDMLRILRKRYPLTKVRLLPVRVQGAGAAAELTGALRYANRKQVADLIIIGRGGGSMEDLWAFNDENLARAVYESDIPVISAVGHEPDVTIIDYVADLRAATPSNGAELAVPDRAELLRVLLQLEQRCQSTLQSRFAAASGRLERAGQQLSRDMTRRTLTAGQTKLEAYQKELEDAARSGIQKRTNQLRHAAALADSLSPYRVLGRGYAMVYDSKNRLCSADALSTGDRITLRGAAHTAECTVLSVEELNESTQKL